MHSTCPYCCGRGTTEVLRTGQDTYGRPVSHWLTMRCHTCLGIGALTAERIAPLERGRRLRSQAPPAQAGSLRRGPSPDASTEGSS